MTHAGGEILVRTHALEKRFDGRVAVDDLNLEIRRGQIFGFLGPNGAGKTTTIRVLLGLMKPTAGDVELFGMSLRKHRLEILSRVGSMVETPSFYRNLTGYENLRLTGDLLGVDHERVDEVLEIVRLTEAAHLLAKTYSQGMKQRLGIALALLGEPELLILDEPTNGLDPAGIREIRELIRRFPDEHGVTVMVSSHNLAEVEMIATHVGIIQSGRMVFDGAIEELLRLNRPVLEVRVDDPDRAAKLLADEGMDGGISVERSEEPSGNEFARRAASINGKLVSSGLEVSHLHARSRTLEDIFLEMTGGKGQP